MTAEHQAIFNAALALPEAERSLLVERLLDSFSPEPEDFTDEELAAELDRRHADFLQNPSLAIPWSELMKEEP